MLKLKDATRLFGIKDGLSFWFNFVITDPVKMFIWLNITHKPYCTHCGYCCHESCTYPKLTKKEDIIKRWAEMDKEMQKVEKGPDGKCVYCGEFRGMETVPDPNGGLGSWWVCVTCRKVIIAQQKLTMGNILNNEKMINEAKDELDFLSAESFMPSFSVMIKRRENDG